jgi:hypothetical protein
MDAGHCRIRRMRRGAMFILYRLIWKDVSWEQRFALLV